MSDPKITLIKFGGDFCSPCKALDRAKTLEKLVARHPNVTIVKHNVADKEGMTPPGSEYEKGEKLAQIYGVNGLPTLVFEDANQHELGRFEGGIRLDELEELYQKSALRARFKAGASINELIPDESQDEDD